MDNLIFAIESFLSPNKTDLIITEANQLASNGWINNKLIRIKMMPTETPAKKCSVNNVKIGILFKKEIYLALVDQNIYQTMQQNKKQWCFNAK